MKTLVAKRRPEAVAELRKIALRLCPNVNALPDKLERSIGDACAAEVEKKKFAVKEAFNSVFGVGAFETDWKAEILEYTASGLLEDVLGLVSPMGSSGRSRSKRNRTKVNTDALENGVVKCAKKKKSN